LKDKFHEVKQHFLADFPGTLKTLAELLGVL